MALTDSGAPSALKELKGPGKFAYDRLEFPGDLGEGTRHPYYVTFYINSSTRSKYNGKSPLSKAGPTGEDSRSSIQKHQDKLPTHALNIPSTEIGFRRKTTRTGTSIRLFVPDTLAWSYSQGYRDVALANIPGVAAITGAVGIGTAIADFKDGWGDSGLKKLSKLEDAVGLPLAELAGSTLLGGDNNLGASALGVVVNPNIDVLYESPTLRRFTFEFLMAPRTRRESKAAADIVKQFKFHSAPEILDTVNNAGRYFIPPAEFDIEFSVDTLGKISTCVLEDLTVDYATQGASFYADGSPVFTRMTLAFKELEFVTKELIEEGF